MATAALSQQRALLARTLPPKKNKKKTKKQLTSQLALPPFPHRCSRRVCRGKGEAAASPRGRTAPGGAPPQGLAAPTRCLNSAERLPLLDSSMFMTLVFVPRMLNFRDLKRGKKKDTVWPAAPSGQTHGRTFAGVKSRSKKERKEKEKPSRLPPECCNITRVPRKGKREMWSRPRPPRTAGGVGGTASSPTTPPRAVPTTWEWISGTHGHPVPSPGVTPALSAGMGLDLGAAGTCWDPKSSTQGQSTGLTCRCRL